MQRQVFVPTHFWLKDNYDKKVEDLKVLEVAGGTGRVMTFFRDNYPEMEATFLELSPYYLEEARKNDARFRKQFEMNDERSKNGWKMSPLNLVLGKAEDMPFENESYDILNCVYLFHELPNEVRRECAKEFFRVLKPGGLLAFNDSIQGNDRIGMTQETMKVFPDKYHEPYYLDYLQDDLKAVFEEAGFVQYREPEIANRSKVMSFMKPKDKKDFEDCDLNREVEEVCNGDEEAKETVMKSQTTDQEESHLMEQESKKEEPELIIKSEAEAEESVKIIDDG